MINGNTDFESFQSRYFLLFNNLKAKIMPEEQSIANPASDSATAATQQQVQQPSGGSTTGYGDVQQGTESATSPTPSLPDESSEPSLEVLKKEYGKLRQEQEELKKEREKAAQLEKYNQAYTNWILSDPSRAKQAMVELEGKTVEEADRILEEAKKTNPDRWKQQADPKEDVEKTARAVFEAERTKWETLEKFRKTLPELDLDTAKDETERTKRYEMATKTNKLAITMVETLGITPEQAWMRAYQELTGQTTAEIEKAREEGHLAGMLAANANRATIKSPTTGEAGHTETKSRVQLTESQKAVAKASRMSDEEYADWLNKPGIVT